MASSFDKKLAKAKTKMKKGSKTDSQKSWQSHRWRWQINHRCWL